MDSLNLMHSYLSERKQCVKVGVDLSTWKNIYKGEPQGSILGPVLFKLFLNDTFNFVEESMLYNTQQLYFFFTINFASIQIKTNTFI
jgi:hypothetical protein